MRKIKSPFKYLFVMSIAFGIFGCQEQFSPLELDITDETSTDTDQTLIAGKASAAAERFIVIFDETVNNAAGERLIAATGGTLLKPLSVIHGNAVLLPAQAVTALRGTEGVALIEKDRIVSLPDPGIHGNGKGWGKPDKPPKGDKEPPPPPPAEALQWGVDRIDADLAWSISIGASVKVGILDSGIDPDHPDLTVVGGINTINPRKSYKDDNGHGTHVSGTVAALDNEIGVIGVGHAAELYAVKAFNRNGTAFTSDIIEGIQWCINNSIQVINMSFGSSVPSTSEELAIQAAYTAGITMVAAAGNSGSTVSYPAKYAETIAVAASDANDDIAGFSNWGPEIDLIAPEVDILSTYRGSGYAIGSGTSMATPHVTGTAALVLFNQQGLSPAGVKDLLQESAEDIGLSIYEQGAGLVNAEEAVRPLVVLN